MDIFINNFFSYIGLSMLSVALLLSIISLTSKRKTINSREAANTTMMYLLLFCAGISFLWQAVFYALMPQTAAITQGYLPSPFEWQVSGAYVGVALVGLIGAFSAKRFRLASIVLTTAVMWGQGAANLCFTSAQGQHMLLSNLNLTAELLTPCLLIALYFFATKKASSAPVTATA